MSAIHVPEPLRENLGPDAAQALVELINGAGDMVRADVMLLAEERFARRLAESLASLEIRLTEKMTEKIASLETRLTASSASLEVRLTDKMAALETRVVRWAFVFWVGQLAAVVAILFAFFRR